MVGRYPAYGHLTMSSTPTPSSTKMTRGEMMVKGTPNMPHSPKANTSANRTVMTDVSPKAALQERWKQAFASSVALDVGDEDCGELARPSGP